MDTHRLHVISRCPPLAALAPMSIIDREGMRKICARPSNKTRTNHQKLNGFKEIPLVSSRVKPVITAHLLIVLSKNLRSSAFSFSLVFKGTYNYIANSN